MSPDRKLYTDQNPSTEITHTEVPQELHDKRGRIKWVARGMSPEEKAQAIERHARNFLEEGITISYKALQEAGQYGFTAAIYRYYPGGIPTLQQTLGIAEGKYQKPRGYWTNEVLEAEAERFYEEHKGITVKLLKETGRQNLLGATDRYPGRLQGLKDKLGVSNRKPRGYWTPENIEKEATEFYENEHALDHIALKRKGRGIYQQQ